MSHVDTSNSDVAPLRRALLRHAREAFGSQETADRTWEALGFTDAPDVARATAEYDEFASALEAGGATIEWLPERPGLTLDSIYVRDASVVTDRGVVLCRMGKTSRATEPDAQAAAFRALGIPVLGRIEPPGRLEGGDVVWLDPHTIAVGEGYRTDRDGIDQLARLLAGVADRVIPVPLPHWRGPDDVFHLMSILSPVAENLALVYSPLLPVTFRNELLDRGFRLVEVPDEEFETQGANVLALAPCRCLALEGNPRTRRRLEAAGVEVRTYGGEEISMKGLGGPTCLTRPLVRG